MLKANSKKMTLMLLHLFLCLKIKIEQCFLECWITANTDFNWNQMPYFNTSILKKSLHFGGILFRSAHLIWFYERSSAYGVH